MTWNQSLFSKKNRNISGADQRMDGYHSLTAPNEIDSDLRRISHKIQKSLAKEGLFIERTPHGLMVGRCDMIGNLIGMDHEYAREFDFGGTSGERRAIRFGHAYHTNLSKGPSIPDHSELLSKQKTDILHLLSEAHAGREPISMPLADFTNARQSGTEWDRIASDVEAGKCKGGIFSTEGKLLERFEDISEQAAKGAQKKTPSPPREMASALPKRSGCMVVGAVLAGVVLMGWVAHIMMQRAQDRQNGTQTMVAKR